MPALIRRITSLQEAEDAIFTILEMAEGLYAEPASREPVFNSWLMQLSGDIDSMLQDRVDLLQLKEQVVPHV